MKISEIINFALGPAGAAILNIVIIPISAWIFPPADIGKIAMLQVVLNLALLLFTLGLDQAYVREFFESNDKASLFSLTATPGIVLFFLVAAVLIVFAPEQLSTLLFESEDNVHAYLALLCCLCALTSRFTSLTLRMNFKGLAFSLVQITPKAVILTGLFALIALSNQPNFSQLLLIHTAALVMTAITSLAFAKKSPIDFKIKINQLQHLGKLLRFSLPLLIGGLATFVLTSTDRVLLRYYSDYSELAIYSIALNLAAMGTLFSAIFNTLWAPTVYKWSSEGTNREKTRTMDSYILFIVVLFFCAAGLFSHLIPYLFPEHYEPAHLIFTACLCFPLLYVLGETASINIGISRRSTLSMLASCGAAIANFFICLRLIPTMGAQGAAISTAASALIFLVLRVELSSLALYTLPRKKMYFFATLSVTISIATPALNSLSTILLWAAVLACLLFCYRKESKNILFFLSKPKQSIKQLHHEN